MRRRNTLAALLITAAVAVTAAACDDDDGGEGSGSTPPEMSGATSDTGSPTSSGSATSTAPAGPTGPGCSALPTDGEGSVNGMADDTAGVAIANNPELSTLAAAIDAAGLADTLNSPGPFTVLAPVDTAFTALPELDAVLGDPQRSAELLALHIVEGQRLSSADLVAAGTVRAIGGDLGIASDGGALVINGIATVACFDVSTANATVHLIEGVLVPPVVEDAVGGTTLYSVDLQTGRAASLGPIGEELGVLGIAFVPDGDASTVYGLTDAPELITFDAADPSTIVTSVAISGVAEGSTLLAIDVRPADGSIVALSDAGVLYTIDASTGAATPVGEGDDPPIEDPGFGFDVNPLVDQIRVAVATSQNVRLDPDTGAVALDDDTGEPAVDETFRYPDGDAAAGTSPRLVAVAYTNPVDGAEETQLYAIDAAAGTLTRIDIPNDGVVATIGPLGITVTDGASFDISASGEALLASPG